jgi:epoxyqueuosine reductase
MSLGTLTDQLKGEALRLGFDLTGACPAVAPPGLHRFRQWLADGYAGGMRYLASRAEAYEHPCHVLEGARSLLVLGLNYRTAEPLEPDPGQGKVSRYAWGAVDYHDVIRKRLRSLADFHRRLTPSARVRGVVDTAPLLEREFGRLAGLGWIGKNTMLLNTRLGSWFFLAALVTTEELDYDEPFVSDHCGSCRACVDACPTGALVEPYRLDARKCISYLTIEVPDGISAEHRQGTDNWLFGCDICQDVCPWNRRTPTTQDSSFRPLPEMNPVGVADLLTLDEAAFRARFRRTPLWRPKRSGLLRNAALLLGRRPHSAALGPLIRGLNDTDRVVRSACAWALRNYREPAAQAALQERLEVELDTAVREEVRTALGRLEFADPPSRTGRQPDSHWD